MSAIDTASAAGIVVEIHGMLVTVLMPDGERIRARPPRDRTTPIIGDRAEVIRESGEYRVSALGPRARVFMRPNAKGGQLVAAHVDRLVIVTAVDPGPRPGLIDRMITALGDRTVEIVLVLNKCDLPSAAEASRELDDHVAIGATRLHTSSHTGEGIAALSERLTYGLSLIVGHSGVGKSSIVNALTGSSLATAAVNDFTSKGRHTTTVATCHVLPGVTAATGQTREHLIVDTPGIRAFPLDGLPLYEVAERFPGFAEAAERCHFARCMHEDEPGCVVRAEQPAERIARYSALLASLREEAAESRAPRYPDKRKAPPPRRR